MEEQFKNKLKNHKVDWDKEDLLGPIQKELSKRKSRYGRWLFLIPLLFISTCWSLNQTDYFSNSKIESNVDIKSEISKTNEVEKAKAPLTKTSATENKNPIEKKQPVDTSNRNQTTSNNQKFSNLEKRNAKTSIISNTKSISTNKFANTSTTLSGSSLSFRDVVVFPKDNIINSNVSLSKITETSVTRSINDTTNNVRLSNGNGLEKILLVEPIPLLKILAFSSDIESPSNLIVPTIRDFIHEQDDVMVDKKNYFFASFSANIGFVDRSFQSLRDGVNSEELKINEQTIESHCLVSSDLTIGYQHRSGLFLESGLEYNRIFETFTYEDTTNFEVMDVLNEKAYYFVNQNLDTVFFSESVQLENSDIRKVRHNNHHTYFNIPLRIGFRYTIRKLNLYNTIGVNYTFTNNFKGRDLQLREDDVVTIVDDPVFDLQNRFGFQLGMGVEHPISKRANLFARVAYQRSPKLSRGEMVQLYQSYSLGLGLRMLFQ